MDAALHRVQGIPIGIGADGGFFHDSSGRPLLQGWHCGSLFIFFYKCLSLSRHPLERTGRGVHLDELVEKLGDRNPRTRWTTLVACLFGWLALAAQRGTQVHVVIACTNDSGSQTRLLILFSGLR